MSDDTDADAGGTKVCSVDAEIFDSVGQAVEFVRKSGGGVVRVSASMKKFVDAYDKSEMPDNVTFEYVDD